MTKSGVFVSRSVLASFAAMSAVTLAEDLSRYRDFQFGMDLPAVARQAGETLEQVKVIHRRPVLIQELLWRPQARGASSQTETAKNVVFSFYDGKLFQVVISYDRYETEGLTEEDIVNAISATYGTAAKPRSLPKPSNGPYGDQEETLATWQDPLHRFDLIRSSYGPSFRLAGILKSLEAPAQAAILDAKRLDDTEAPQREAARTASEEETARVKLEKARVANLPNFRP